MSSQPRKLRTWIVVGAAAVGAALGGAALAGAATGGSTTAATTATSTATGSAPSGQPANAPDPATVTHGPNETLLTGTTADKVKATALAAVPGGTIIRVETDSAGSPYEAHVTKSDGSQVTVKIDADFKVTTIDQGFGAGPNGGQAPSGAPAASGSAA